MLAFEQTLSGVRLLAFVGCGARHQGAVLTIRAHLVDGGPARWHTDRRGARGSSPQPVLGRGRYRCADSVARSGALERTISMPRVSYASVSKPQPDRLEDAIELARQAGKLIGRHGPVCRLLAADTAGEQTGTLVFTVEFESLERYASEIERIDQDTEVRDLQVSLTRSTSPTVILATSLSTEIPLPGTHTSGHGPIVEVHITKPASGRFEGAVEEADTAATLLEKAGAVGVQGFSMAYAGTQSGSVGLAVDWPSIAVQAKSGAIWATDPVGTKLMSGMLNGTSASMLLSSALYRDIPL
jgi:hypothetical protein